MNSYPTISAQSSKFLIFLVQFCSKTLTQMTHFLDETGNIPNQMDIHML